MNFLNDSNYELINKKNNDLYIDALPLPDTTCDEAIKLTEKYKKVITQALFFQAAALALNYGVTDGTTLSGSTASDKGGIATGVQGLIWSIFNNSFLTKHVWKNGLGPSDRGGYLNMPGYTTIKQIGAEDGRVHHPSESFPYAQHHGLRNSLMIRPNHSTDLGVLFLEILSFKAALKASRLAKKIKRCTSLSSNLMITSIGAIGSGIIAVAKNEIEKSSVLQNAYDDYGREKSKVDPSNTGFSGGKNLTFAGGIPIVADPVNGSNLASLTPAATPGKYKKAEINLSINGIFPYTVYNNSKDGEEVGMLPINQSSSGSGWGMSINSPMQYFILKRRCQTKFLVNNILAGLHSVMGIMYIIGLAMERNKINKELKTLKTKNILAIQNSDSVKNNTLSSPCSPLNSIYSIIKSNPELSKFANEIDNSNEITNLLKNDGPFIIFCPNNKSLDSAKINKPIQQVIKYHIIRDNDNNNLLEMGSYTTLQGSEITIEEKKEKLIKRWFEKILLEEDDEIINYYLHGDKSESLFNSNKAKILSNECDGIIKASNGYVMVIDGILNPPSPPSPSPSPSPPNPNPNPNCPIPTPKEIGEMTKILDAHQEITIYSIETIYSALKDSILTINDVLVRAENLYLDGNCVPRNIMSSCSGKYLRNELNKIIDWEESLTEILIDIENSESNKNKSKSNPNKSMFVEMKNIYSRWLNKKNANFEEFKSILSQVDSLINKQFMTMSQQLVAIKTICKKQMDNGGANDPENLFYTLTNQSRYQEWLTKFKYWINSGTQKPPMENDCEYVSPYENFIINTKWGVPVPPTDKKKKKSCKFVSNDVKKWERQDAYGYDNNVKPSTMQNEEEINLQNSYGNNMKAVTDMVRYNTIPTTNLPMSDAKINTRKIYCENKEYIEMLKNKYNKDIELKSNNNSKLTPKKKYYESSGYKNISTGNKNGKIGSNDPRFYNTGIIIGEGTVDSVDSKGQCIINKNILVKNNDANLKKGDEVKYQAIPTKEDNYKYESLTVEKINDNTDDDTEMSDMMKCAEEMTKSANKMSKECESLDCDENENKRDKVSEKENEDNEDEEEEDEN